MVGVLDSRSSGLGSSLSRGYCVVFWTRHFTPGRRGAPVFKKDGTAHWKF